MAGELVPMMEWDIDNDITSSMFTFGWYSSPLDPWAKPYYYTFNGRLYLTGAIQWTNGINFTNSNDANPEANQSMIAAGTLPAEVRPAATTRVKLVIDQQNADHYEGIDYYAADIRPDGSLTLIADEDDFQYRRLPTVEREGPLLLDGVSWPIAVDEDVSATAFPLGPLVYVESDDAKLVTGGGRVRATGSVTSITEPGTSIIVDPIEPDSLKPQFDEETFEAFHKIPLLDEDGNWWVSQVFADTSHFWWALQDRDPKPDWYAWDLNAEEVPWLGRDISWAARSINVAGVTMAGEVAPPLTDTSYLGGTVTEDIHSITGTVLPNDFDPTDSQVAAGLVLAGADLTGLTPTFYIGRYRRNPLAPDEFRYEIRRHDAAHPTGLIIAFNGYEQIDETNVGDLVTMTFSYRRTETHVVLRLQYHPNFFIEASDPIADALDVGLAGYFTNNGPDWLIEKEGGGGGRNDPASATLGEGMTLLLDGAGWYGGIEVLRGLVILGLVAGGAVNAGRVVGQGITESLLPGTRGDRLDAAGAVAGAVTLTPGGHGAVRRP